MVKSSSCLRLITSSGGGEKGQDQRVVYEVKDSNDKRGWSFRKRVARHRMLSNAVIAVTETPTSANKEISEYSSVNFQSPAESIVVEKIYLTTLNLDNMKTS